MIKFKQADWILQLTLILAGVLLVFIRKSAIAISDLDFSLSYMIVGGWQLLSVIVHFFFPASTKISSRKWYLVLTTVTLLLSALFIISDNETLIPFLLVMLVWTPCLAIFYLGICITETRALVRNK